MSAIAVRVEGLGKRYEMAPTISSGLLGDELAASIARPWRKARAWFNRDAAAPDSARTFWALRHLSFELKHGEAVGIIGRNGAGKSTLLKVLSRITKPTEGRAELFGRVGSLLEVGTGFHPELSGRDNVYLNGAILGMHRREIRQRFDEIVAFAEVERFIDTPVKHYSSGMAVRLAFAVAAHLEPEILLVDEVLAVGDTAFQKKCLGKMGDVTREGRTVILVSHDLTSIQMLCRRALRIAHGQVLGFGPVDDEVRAYLDDAKFFARGALDHAIELSPNARLEAFGFVPHVVVSGAAAEFRVKAVVTEAMRFHEIAALIHDSMNRRIGVLDLRVAEGPYAATPDEPLELVADVRALPLVEGEYRIGLSIRSDEGHAIKYDVVTLDVVSKSDGDVVPYQASVRGVVAFDHAVRRDRSRA